MPTFSDRRSLKIFVLFFYSLELSLLKSLSCALSFVIFLLSSISLGLSLELSLLSSRTL